MSLFEQKSNILITCPKGISPYLKEEIISLGFPVLSELVAGIATEGTLEDTMKINLYIRTGHRVLFLLDKFNAKHPDDLYKKVSIIPWEDYIQKDGYICVTSSVDNPNIKDPRFAGLKCKDAIVDRFHKKFGCRPNSGSRRNRTVVHLFWQKDLCLVYLDTSGESLSRHGYRKIPLKAPMQETLAAATLLASRWNGKGNFINPMCGSGTIAIEAALIALERSPGLLRNNFGFMHINGFNKSSWKGKNCETLQTEKQKRPLKERSLQLISAVMPSMQRGKMQQRQV